MKRAGRGVAARVHAGGVPESGRAERLAELTAGGTEGNQRLTAVTGAALLVLLAVIGVTILRIGQLISVHLFVGLLLIGPVLLKLASTGYRFVRYYTHELAYRRKGPPALALRLIAPGVVISTAVVLGSGIVLMFLGPTRRDQWLLIHKVSFFVWLAFTAVHVLGHLGHLGDSLRAELAEHRGIDSLPGRGGRGIALVGAMVAGVVLAVVLIPDFAPWTGHLAFVHHHRG